MLDGLKFLYLQNAVPQIFVDAAGDCATLIVPIMTAGAVVFVGMLGFKVGKKVLSSSVG